MRSQNGTLGPVKEKNISVTVYMGYETFYTGWSSPDMPLFNQLLRELFVPIQFFNSAVNVRRQTFKISIQLWTATAHVWPYFEQNRTSGVHTDRTSCRNDWPRGFHDFTFLCVIRSPSRFSTARTNITDTFPSIVVTNVEEVWLKNASSRGFKGPASSYVPFDQRSGNNPVCAVLANGVPD